MRVAGRHYRSIWLDTASNLPQIIDQTQLPHRFEIRTITDVASAVEAIATMRVRGAPLIGATAAHAIALALSVDASDAALARAANDLLATRPTAVNLSWAVARMVNVVSNCEYGERAGRALDEALLICNEDVASCEAIGNHGLEILRNIAMSKSSEPLQILTHCNAGWLATVDWGTALAPIYKAHDAGLSVHVWVDETRPRNQGGILTAFELREHGVPHTVVVDNAGGHLMQRGRVDAVFVGSDRTAANGDVCNKIGTYLKALAAFDCGVPFYVALPLSTVDWTVNDGLQEIPIEERDQEEIRVVRGIDNAGNIQEVEIFPSASAAANPAFDITPARLVTGLITERGLCSADAEGLSTQRAEVSTN